MLIYEMALLFFLCLGATRAVKKTLDEIRKAHSETFKEVSHSLGLSPEQDVFFQLVIKNAITFFDKKSGVKINGIGNLTRTSRN